MGLTFSAGFDGITCPQSQVAFAPFCWAVSLGHIRLHGLCQLGVAALNLLLYAGGRPPPGLSNQKQLSPLIPVSQCN